MSDVDLPAIRNLVAVWNRWAAVASSPNPFAVDLGEACTDLLALVDEQAAARVNLAAAEATASLAVDRADRAAREIARLRAELDAANARTAERCKQLMAANRAVEQLEAERDHWQRVAAGGGDCPVVGCTGEVLRLETWGGDEFVQLSCGHSTPVSPLVVAVVDEVHVTSDAQLAEAVARASDVKPPESPQDGVELPRTRETGGSAA